MGRAVKLLTDGSPGGAMRVTIRIHQRLAVRDLRKLARRDDLCRCKAEGVSTCPQEVIARAVLEITQATGLRRAG